MLFPLLVASTDDFGRMPGDAFTVKNVVLPSSPRLERDFDAALDIMHKVGLIVRYQAEGAIYVQVHQFDEHQSGLHKRTKSKFPEPTEIPGTSEIYRSNRTELNRTEGKGTEPNAPTARVADVLFEEFWSAYPKKKAKEDARRAWDKRRPDASLLRVMLDAVVIQSSSSDWQKNSGQFIPNAATWINGARWTDVLDIDSTVPMMSDTARHNMASMAEMERILREREVTREH